jgi:hypothetical protein
MRCRQAANATSAGVEVLEAMALGGVAIGMGSVTSPRMGEEKEEEATDGGSDDMEGGEDGATDDANDGGGVAPEKSERSCQKKTKNVELISRQ